MSESKIVLTERLRKEGRWDEASKFKDKAIADFRADGMRRSEAAAAAWTAVAEAFPPQLGEGRVSGQNGAGEALEATCMHPIPWNDLPAEADFEDEVRWVHQQYVVIVQDSQQGPQIHWDRATAKAPSTGACSLALWAAENRTAFYKDLLPKTMARSEGPRLSDENTMEVQDPGLKDVEAMLKQLEDEADAELRSNEREVLQKRVHNVLTNWMEKHEVKHSNVALERLDSDICNLIRDSIRALR